MITSRQNEFIKQVRSLKDKKFRDELSLFTAEGSKSVIEALSLNLNVIAVLGTKKGLDSVSMLKKAGKVVEVDENVFSCLSTETSPQGVIAVIEKPKPREIDGSAIFLDGVADPANVGAIIRSAVAFGFNNVYAVNSADPFSPKSVRASMGGIFRANVICGQREEILPKVCLPIVVADMGGENVNNFKPLGNICLVIGNEGNGVSQQVLKKASHVIAIPMENQMESLNAAVSAGILMYQLKTNRR